MFICSEQLKTKVYWGNAYRYNIHKAEEIILTDSRSFSIYWVYLSSYEP